MDGKQLKNLEFAKFSQSGFYQYMFKPYLQELIELEQKRLELDTNSEFFSLKRDIELAKTRTLINKIIKRIELSHEELDRSIQQLQVSVSKLNN